MRAWSKYRYELGSDLTNKIINKYNLEPEFNDIVKKSNIRKIK